MFDKNKKKSKEIEESNIKFTFNTDNIQEITDKLNEGVVLKNYQKPWLKNENGVRREGLIFEMTEEECEEYIACALDVHYFAEKYCKIKREDGTIGDFKLRPYQKDMLELFTNDRVILVGSRQIGKCFIFNTLCDITSSDFKTNQNIKIGNLYYKSLSKTRKLTILEKMKMFLYNLL